MPRMFFYFGSFRVKKRIQLKKVDMGTTDLSSCRTELSGFSGPRIDLRDTNLYLAGTDLYLVGTTLYLIGTDLYLKGTDLYLDF